MSIAPLRNRVGHRGWANLLLGVRLVVLSLSACLVGCAARTPAPKASPSPTRILEVREGLASYYGQEFHGKMAASGVRFDMNAMVAAHPSYPFGTLVRVTNLRNGRSVRVRIQDRGPAPRPRADGVIIDLSRGAAQTLGFIPNGRTRVRLEVLGWGKRQTSSVTRARKRGHDVYDPDERRSGIRWPWPFQSAGTSRTFLHVRSLP